MWLSILFFFLFGEFNLIFFLCGGMCLIFGSACVWSWNGIFWVVCVWPFYLLRKDAWRDLKSLDGALRMCMVFCGVASCLSLSLLYIVWVMWNIHVIHWCSADWWLLLCNFAAAHFSQVHDYVRWQKCMVLWTQLDNIAR